MPQCIRTKARVFKSIDQDYSIPVVKRNESSNFKGNNSGIRVCCRCGDASHKFNKCTFEEISNRADNIIARNNKWIKNGNSLNCLPNASYDVFS